MKRRISIDDTLTNQSKRRSSSVFSSVVTVADSLLDVVAQVNDEISLREVATATTSSHKVLTPTAIPRPSSVHSISSSSLDGTDTSSSPYYATEDDDNEEEGTLIKSMDAPRIEGTLICTDGMISTSTSCSDLGEFGDQDFATAVVFEAGEKHFDRNNRFQKERPLRVTSILEHLKQSPTNLAERCLHFDQIPGEPTSEKEFLDDEDYLRVHLPGYMQRLDFLSSCKCCNRLDDEAQQFQSIFLTPDSVSEAKAAATSLCRLVGSVVEGRAENGFAVIRPPGHHAEPGLAGGFCAINNVAVAAAYARAKLGIQKVLVVDWDVHHGNGTQSIFIKDPNVLYFSVHRWEGGRFFPYSSAGGPKMVGSGEGAGCNMNVGWSNKGMGDEEYLAVWERLLMPVAKEFQPELILVSAGFDAAKGDMGECNVTPECFGKLTSMLMTLADGKIVCALEGGYKRSVLGECVESVICTLLSRKSVEKGTQELDERRVTETDVLDCINKMAAKNIVDTLTAHKPYWKCLQD